MNSPSGSFSSRLIACLLLLLGHSDLLAAPTVSAHPQSLAVEADAAASLTVTATGAGTLSYQWQKDGVDIAGATNGNISISNVQSANVGFYRCKVTDSNGLVTSAEASLRLNGLPLFKVMQNSLTWQQAKVDAVANGGRLAVLDSQAKINHLNAWLQSINNLRLLWIGLTDEEVEGTWKWINGTALGASNWGSGEPNNGVSGEDYAHLLDVGNASKWNDLLNDWWIYTPGGYLLELLPQISFTAQPQTQTVNPGQAATLSAIVSGAGILTYQWQKDGVDIPGATGSSFTLASAKPWHIGDYTVNVTDSNGTVTSNAATLSLTGINSGLWRGVVAYYTFNGNFSDQSPRQNNLTTLKQISLGPDRFGATNKAGVLNANSGQAVSKYPVGIQGNSPRSISVWVRTSATLGTDCDLVGWSEWASPLNGQGFLLQLISGIGGSISVWGDYADLAATGLGDPFLNKWNHIVYTYSSATSANGKIYLNGVPLNNLVTSGDIAFGTIDTELRIGDRGNGLGKAGTSIDDVRIYNRAMSASEVSALYAAENAPNNWRQTHFGSTANTGNAADGADPDQDGLPNLLEYALNLSPNAASRAPAAVQAAGGNLEYTYTRGTAAFNGGTTFQVEWSDDLSTWFTTGVVESLLSDNGTHQQVKATLPAGSGGRRFVRLRVQ